MLRKTTFIVLLLTISLPAQAPMIVSRTPDRNALNVAQNSVISIGIDMDNGTTTNFPDEYDTIQAALYAAQSGDTILVQPSTYNEYVFWPDVNGIKLICAVDFTDAKMRVVVSSISYRDNLYSNILGAYH